MVLDKEEKLVLLKAYYDTRRGVGHTTVMMKGVVGSQHAIVLAHTARYAEDLRNIYGRETQIVTWDALDRLLGRRDALVIDNAAMITILGDALEVMRKLRSENSILRSEKGLSHD